MLFAADFLTTLLFLVTHYGPINIALLYITVGFAPVVPSREKTTPFECGFTTFSDTKNPFNVQYYLTAYYF